MLISDLVPRVAVRVPDAPDFTINEMLRDTLRSFCEVSSAYRVNAVGDLVESSSAVTLTLPTDTALVRVIQAKYDGEFVHPYSERLDYYRKQPTGIPHFFRQNGPTQIELELPSDRTLVGGFEAHVALKPTMNAAEIDDNFIEEWYDAIISGAISLLCKMPKKEWTDYGMADRLAQEFNGAAMYAKAKANRSFDPIEKVVQYGGI